MLNTRNGLTLFRNRDWRPFEDLQRDWGLLWEPREAQQAFVPACEVHEDDKYFVVALEVPGISKDALKVEVLEDTLVVSGERRDEKKEEAKGTWYSERKFGSFTRKFSIPTGTDAERIEAHYQDGVLRLMIPKVEQAQPRQIPVISDAS